MIRGDCQQIRGQLSAYVDGELGGAEMLRVSQHLAVCAECVAEVEAIHSLGEELRDGVTLVSRDREIDHLASDVISRVRAESAQSWRAALGRAFDGWHWAVVGVGSVSATFMLVCLVAAILSFGPRPGRTDSLAALMNNFETPAGTLIVMATFPGRDQQAMLMQIEQGSRRSETLTAVPVGFIGPSERDLVGALADAVTNKGRIVDLAAMDPQARRYAEALLEGITRPKATRLFHTTGTVRIHKIGLVTTTRVSAKGL